MHNRFVRFVARLLIVSLCALPYASNAALVGTDQLVSATQQQTDRVNVANFLSRGDVQQQLQQLGLSPEVAKQRVNALTDDEVRTLAGKIDSMPAGAMSGWGWAALIAIAVAVYLLWK